MNRLRKHTTGLIHRTGLICLLVISTFACATQGKFMSASNFFTPE